MLSSSPFQSASAPVRNLGSFWGATVASRGLDRVMVTIRAAVPSSDRETDRCNWINHVIGFLCLFCSVCIPLKAESYYMISVR